MSPRTDTYLTLCVEQASKSPLHYRHGSIIVRGGKILGRGHNDYRPGFNGGALKTGRVASISNGPAITASKQRRQRQKSPTQLDVSSTSHVAAGTFTPFETSAIGGGGGGRGGGHLANIPLSMHSEMMAIHSALACTGSAGARSARSCQNPCFKLPGRGKRRLRLRGLQAYVEAVCAEAEVEQQLRREGCRSDGGCGSKVGGGVGKWGVQWKRGKGVEDRCGGQGQGQGQWQGGGRQRPTGREGKAEGGRGIWRPCWRTTVARKTEFSNRVGPITTVRIMAIITFTDRMHRHDNMHMNPLRIQLDIAKHRQVRSRNKKAGDTPKPAQPMLIPQGRTGSRSRSVAERTQDQRLKGADLYVARLGWKKEIPSSKNIRKETVQIAPHPTTEDFTNNTISPESPASAIPSPTPPRSLHDELRPPSHPPSPVSNPSPRTDHPSQPLASATSSRPCYRCIAYMQSVGIKRVFWTTATGDWDGAKVRDLVDALERSGSGADLGDGGNGAACGGDGGGMKDGGTTMGREVFVTKHEVLMLRLMGGS